MKKILFAAVISAFLTSFPIAAFGETTEDFSFVVLGDSIAEGFGLPGYTVGNADSSPHSFVNLLGKELNNAGNFSAAGRTSGGLLSQMNNKDIVEALKGADSVILEIGANDVLVPFSQAMMNEIFRNGNLRPDVAAIMKKIVDNSDVEKTKNNIYGIIEKIRQANPDIEIYVLLLYNPYGKDTRYGEEAERTVLEWMEPYNRAVTECESIYGVHAVDVYSAFLGKESEYTKIFFGDPHPNVSGHQKIYETLKDAGFGRGFEKKPDETSVPQQSQPESTPEAVPVGEENFTWIFFAAGGAAAFAIAAAVVAKSKKI